MTGTIYPSLRDRTVLITGGSTGIGAALAAACAHLERPGGRPGFG